MHGTARCARKELQLRLQIIAIQQDQLYIKASLDKLAVQTNKNSSDVALLKSGLTETEKRLEKYNSEKLYRMDTIMLKSSLTNAEADDRISALQANVEKKVDQLEKCSGLTSCPRQYGRPRRHK